MPVRVRLRAPIFLGENLMNLQRSIGKLGLLFVSVGAMIGSGWLFGPLYAAQISGPASILTWVLAGVLVLAVSLVFAELSAMFPLAGGIARFPKFSHGALVSYTMSWLAWIASIMLPAIEVQAMLQYMSNYYTWLTHTTPAGKPMLSLAGLGVAAALLCFMSVLNIMGIKLVARFNIGLVWLKLIVPSLTVAVLMYTQFSLENFTHFGGFMPYGVKSIFSALPMAGVVFSFFGFRLAAELAAETKDPQRSLPLALIVSIVICIVLYTLVQTAFLGVLPVDKLQTGWSHLSYPGDHGPFAGITKHLGLYKLMIILYIDAVLSPFSCALVVVTAAARLNYAMSLNGCLPKILQRLNKRGVPHWAVWMNFFGAVLLLMPFPSWQSLAEFILAALILAHMLAPIVLASLRRQLPNQKRPFFLPKANFMCWLAFIILNIILYWTGWKTILKMLMVLVVGLLVLLIFRCTQSREERVVLHMKHAYWLLPYFLFVSTISWIGNFGGGHAWIPFGWDMLGVAIFATVFFFWGIRCRLPDEQVLKQLSLESVNVDEENVVLV